MRTNKGVVSLSLIDYSVRIIDEIADYDEKFAYFVYESEIKESFLHNGKLVCLDTNNITILDNLKKIQMIKKKLNIFSKENPITTCAIAVRVICLKSESSISLN